MAPKIRIVKATKPSFNCYGCSYMTDEPFHYEGDTETHWCSECFVTEKMLEETKKNMPIWQSLLKPKPKPKPKIRIVKSLPTHIKIVKTLPTA